MMVRRMNGDSAIAMCDIAIHAPRIMMVRRMNARE